MQFAWDDIKRRKNINKHGLDFIRAPELFSENHVRKRANDGENGEERWIAMGIVQGRYVSLIYTMRGETVRIISFRSARDDEKREHQNIFG